MLSIKMLGQVNISYNGVNITDKLSTKLIALICLLVLNHNREMSREVVGLIYGRTAMRRLPDTTCAIICGWLKS